MMPSTFELTETLPSPISILVVEDEAIIAREIATRLKGLGYTVAGVCKSGEEAIVETGAKLPSLVLMDIELKGDMDGIEAAGEIHLQFDVPVVYVTSYTDAETLRRVKATDPFGYIVKPISDNALPAAIEMALSKHRQHQELKANLALLFTTLRSIGDAVIAANLDGEIWLLNSAAEMLTGWPEEEALGRNVGEVVHLVDEMTNVEIAILGTAPASDSRAAALPNVMLVSRNANRIPIERTASPISVDGIALGNIIVLHDISVRRGLKDQLLQVQKMEMVGRLAGGIAHDFNNLLTVILGYSAEILSSLPPEHPLCASVKHIENAANLGGAITKRLLSFSRKQAFRPQVLNLNALILGLSGMLERLVGEWIQLETFLGAENGTICGDKAQVEQLLMNLVLNARDAMPEGGRIVIATRDEIVSSRPVLATNSNLKPGPYTVLTVEDNGTEIAEEVLPKIFEPYFTTKDPALVAGFGLSVVHGTVKQCGGEIDVSSTPGEGTIFEMYLPQAEHTIETTPVQVPTTFSFKTGTLALIVEDEPGILALLQSVFEAQGFQVVPASTAEEALLAIDSFQARVDLLVADVRLPKLNGVNLAKLLRARYPGMRVLFISGYVQAELEAEIQFDLDARLLHKPFTSAEVFAEVQELIRPKRLSRQANIQ